MKTNHIASTRTIVTLIAVYLISVFQNIYGQQGYYPGFHSPPSRTIIVPYPPAQSYPQVVRPYIHTTVAAPVISLGIHFDPLISWFSTNGYNNRNDGVVPGFNFGILYNRYFTPNYSFSSGINIINAGGRLISNEATNLELRNNYNNIVIVQPGEAVTYRITYLSVPLGIKLRTSQLGFGKFFTDFGFDPKIVLGARADIPSLNISGGNVLPELNTFNLSFHIMAGMQYPLGPYNTFSVGIGFDNNLFDTTKDNGGPSSDVVSQKSVSFRMGITF